jgi:hypothetical protein
VRLPRLSGFIEPCLPSPAPNPLAGDGWIHEIKLDGFRMLARRDGAGVRLLTRRGIDWTTRYPAIAVTARTRAGPLRSPDIGWAKVMTERYRELARECLRLANLLQALNTWEQDARQMMTGNDCPCRPTYRFIDRIPPRHFATRGGDGMVGLILINLVP